MPWPISPAPATKTRSISVAMRSMVRGARRSVPGWGARAGFLAADDAASPLRIDVAEQLIRGRVRVEPVLRDLAEQRLRRGPAGGFEEPRPEAFRDDREDLCLGPGQPSRRRLPRPPGCAVPVQRGKQLRARRPRSRPS